jgi:RND family efflux transporter MFP subunit
MLRRRWFWIVLLLLVIIGAAYAYYTGHLTIPGLTPAQTPATEQQQVSSAPVTTGDLIVKVDGIGNLLASHEVKLGFRASGTVNKVAVQPGDQVEVGALLATLDDTALRYQVVQAGISTRQAQLQLASVTQPDATSIATARSNLAAAQTELTQLTIPPTASQLAGAREDLLSSQQALNQLLSGIDPDKKTSLEATLRTADIAVQKAQSAYEKVAWRNDAGVTAESAALQDAMIAYEKAKADYNVAAAGPTADTVTAARAKISKAQDALEQLTKGPDPQQVEAAKAKVAAAQQQLDNLLGGGDPKAVENAQLAVQQAELTMQARMLDLTGAVITSPVTGTVTAVDITVGQQAGSAPVITIDEGVTAQVRFWIDESDAAKVAVGNKVNVTFGAYDNLIFTGQVVRIDPTLVTVSGASTVQVWAALTPNQHPVQLLYGMSADVEVIAGEARNALLVPVQSLRQLTPGQYAVFVVLPNGDLEMHPVKVGLKDAVNAQILEGLKVGDQVSTGTARSTQSGGNAPQGNGAGGNFGGRGG